jgi:RNA polymerase sigma factor (sigma-70 family)
MAREAQRELLEAISRLPPKLRAAVELVYDGFDINEIAEKLGLHRNTVRQRLNSVRTPKVRRMLLDVIEVDGEELLHIRNPLVRSPFN